jgi:hypothetical protein
MDDGNVWEIARRSWKREIMKNAKFRREAYAKT